MINFDRESHLKENTLSQKQNFSTTDDICSDLSQSPTYGINYNNEEESIEEDYGSSGKTFERKFINIDATSCWLNSSLQLVLTALDHSNVCRYFSSELGKELISLKSSQKEYLDATNVKHILVSAEDLRIATRISQISDEIKDPHILRRRLENIEDLRLNLISGQQCVRDFLLCITQNHISWPDVYSCLSFSTNYLSRCTLCKDETKWNLIQTYIELDVPEVNSSLHTVIEQYFNESSVSKNFCESCRSDVEKVRRNQITSIEDTPFITVILRRAVDSQYGMKLNKNAVISTNDISLM